MSTPISDFLKGTAFILALLLCARGGRAQEPAPLLRILSPADGTQVAPGDPVHVVVAAVDGIAFSAIGVIATDPIDSSELRNAPPYDFTLTIPASIAPGEYNLTAVGRAPSGLTGSMPVVLRVELSKAPENVPVNLRFEPSRVELEAFGEEIPVRVIARLKDGSDVDVTRSSRLTLHSESPAIAATNPGIMVRAIHPGITAVVASYAEGSSARLQVVTLPPVLRLSDESLRFETVSVGHESAPHVLTLTNVTKAPLEITALAVGDDFRMRDNCTDSPLAAGASCAIRLSFAGPASQPQATSIVISTSAVAGQTVVPLLYGDITPPR